MTLEANSIFNSIINFEFHLEKSSPNHLQNGDGEEIAPETIWVGILRLLKNVFDTSCIFNYLFNDLITLKNKYVTCPCGILNIASFLYKLLILSIFEKNALDRKRKKMQLSTSLDSFQLLVYVVIWL